MTTATTFDLPELRRASNEACALMRVMSNPDRLLLLCQLSQGERRVGELEELLDIQQPTLSQQLAVLREEALAMVRDVEAELLPGVLSMSTNLLPEVCHPCCACAHAV